MLTLAKAQAFQSEAEALLLGLKHEPASTDVLALAARSGRSAYDCEFVALAAQLETMLVTEDAPLRASFPHIAVSLQEALA